jgi:hypothetical protein
MTLRRLVASLLMVCGWGCNGGVTGPPPGAVPFVPSVQFRLWWTLTEACSGRSGDFDAVKWYVLPQQSSFALEGQGVNAAWYGDGNAIVFGFGQQYYPNLVRHEMLHALLQSGTHPRDEFLGKCGDVVVCVGVCVSDAGGPPDTSAVAQLVPADSMTVVSTAIPNPISLSADSGYLPIMVAATNTAPIPVRVAIPPVVPGGDPSASFSYAIAPVAAGGVTQRGAAQQNAYFLLFAPTGTAGATRRLVFDDEKVLAYVPSGVYNVTGAFLTKPSAPTRLTVDP